MDHRAEMVRDGVLSAPPLTVAGLTLFGVGLQDVVLLLAAVWTTLQIGWFLWLRYKELSKEDKE